MEEEKRAPVYFGKDIKLASGEVIKKGELLGFSKIAEEKEYRVEFNLTGQGHYIIASGCFEAIEKAKPEYARGMGIKEADFVMCELWKKDGKRVGKESIFKDVEQPKE